MITDERYLEYVELFNERSFYECHEVLEDLWLDVEGCDRDFYKALIQYAAAFLLLFRHRHKGSLARFETTQKYLTGFPDRHHGLDLSQIRSNIEFWIKHLNQPSPRYKDAFVPFLELQTI